MRRLVIAASAALAFHALLLVSDPKGCRGRTSVPAVRQESLSITLASLAPPVRLPEMPMSRPEEPAPSQPSSTKPAPGKKESTIRVKPRKNLAGISEEVAAPADPPISTSEHTVATAPEEPTEVPVSADASSAPSTPEAGFLSPSNAGDASGPSLPVKEAVPIYRSNPAPEYPAVARRRGYEGTVVLEVLVNPDGKVADLRLFRSSGHAVLDQTALASVKAWIFDPARRGQEAVEMWVKIPVRFRLTDGGTP